MEELSEDAKAFELCNATWKRIVSKYRADAEGTDFEPKERTVVLVWTVSGIVGNDGFEYLFSGDLPGDPDYKLSLEAFREIGSKKAAKAIEDALATFPNGNIPTDYSERKAKYLEYSEEERDRIEMSFFEADNEINTQLAAYIRRNALE